MQIDNGFCFNIQLRLFSHARFKLVASFMIHFSSLLKINRQINQMCYTFFICRSKEIRSPWKIFTSPHINSSIVRWFLKMLLYVSNPHFLLKKIQFLNIFCCYPGASFLLYLPICVIVNSIPTININRTSAINYISFDS